MPIVSSLTAYAAAHGPYNASEATGVPVCRFVPDLLPGMDAEVAALGRHLNKCIGVLHQRT